LILGPVWGSISESAKDLIKQLLTYKPTDRISAINAYAHPWIQANDFTSMDESKVQELMVNMGKFYVNSYFNYLSLL
jgi:serine/threonine protein kinase